MTVLTRRSRWSAPLAAAVATTALTFAPTSPAQAAPTTDPATSAAAGWLANRMIANNYVMPGFSGTGTDWGLTIDTVFALASAGVAKDVADEAVDRLADSGMAFIQNGGVGTRAKLALALQVGGADPTRFATPTGPVDLVAGIRDSLQSSGQFTGANHFAQSLAVLVLARTADGVPDAAADYLLTLQCTTVGDVNEGGFGTKGGAGACGSVDGDATGMIVSALAAADYDAQDAPMQKAISWMTARQKADGSFAAQTTATTGNGNSTGLVGQAARQLGTEASTAVADKAAQFVSGLQVTCAVPFVEGATDPATGGGFIRSWRGALAYNQAGFNTAVTGGIKSFQQDQWRRGSAQAILTLGDGPGFSELSLDDAAAGVPALPACPLTGTAPTVTGDAAVGGTLTATPGLFTPAIQGLDITWRWLRDGTPIAGATSASYTVTLADANTAVTVEATATDPLAGFTTAVQTSSAATIAALPAKAFSISASTRPVARAASTSVRMSGLLAGEPYRLTLSGTTVHTGVAAANGSASATIRIPSAFGTHKRRVLRVVGAASNRVGERTLATAGPAKLKASVSKKKIKAKKTQKITVRGLLPRERLTIKVTGKSTKTAYASASGKYTYSFKVTKKKGTKKVAVTGAYSSRKGSTSFKVTK